MTAPRDPLGHAARDARRRAKQAKDDPEPSLARRLGQIGILGWMTVVPTLLGVFVGGLLDRWLATGITFAAALTMLGAGFGLWLAIKWMNEQ